LHLHLGSNHFSTVDVSIFLFLLGDIEWERFLLWVS
jgi:hypothetical protein